MGAYVASIEDTNSRGGAPLSNLDPPGPRGVPLVGNALHFRRDPLGFLTRAAPTVIERNIELA